MLNFINNSADSPPYKIYVILYSLLLLSSFLLGFPLLYIPKLPPARISSTPILLEPHPVRIANTPILLDPRPVRNYSTPILLDPLLSRFPVLLFS